jgi:uncharacterized membrane protein
MTTQPTRPGVFNPATDERLELALGHLLRAGVIIASLVTIAGGVMILRQPQSDAVIYTSVSQVIAGLHQHSGAAVVMVGLFILLATPVLRVLCMLVAFLLQKDWTYAAFSAFVLAVLGVRLVFDRL